jgi:hypothetical protein
LRIRDFRWYSDFVLPLLLMLVMAWAFSRGVWELGLLVGASLLFRAVWTLRRIEVSEGGVVAKALQLPGQLPQKAATVIGWMVALGGLLVVLARSGIEPVSLLIAGVGFAAFAPIITILVGRVTAWLRR